MRPKFASLLNRDARLRLCSEWLWITDPAPTNLFVFIILLHVKSCGSSTSIWVNGIYSTFGCGPLLALPNYWLVDIWRPNHPCWDAKINWAGAAESWHESKHNFRPWSTTKILLGRRWHPSKHAPRLLLCWCNCASVIVLEVLCGLFLCCPRSLPFVSSEELPEDGSFLLMLLMSCLGGNLWGQGQCKEGRDQHTSYCTRTNFTV